MSKRKMKGTGWVDYQKHPRGPNGRGLCRMCGEEVPKGRRTFCDDICVHQYKLRNQPRYASGQLYKRDRGKCAICGIDTYKVRREFLKERNECKKKTLKETQGCIKQVEQKYKDAGWSPLYNSRWYDTHHLLSVVEGGGPQDYPLDMDYLSNLQTMCKVCHKKETKKLRGRLKNKNGR
jgi:5-methylcytosine-specific restriction enzyme A